MKNSVKVIFHIDLNAFYATVSEINDPYLKNKAFVVGGSSISNRGVISTASYAARAYGIGAGMTVNEAMDLYPNVLVVPTKYSEYAKYSNIFFNYLMRYSKIILKGSIDEAYLDVTELSKTRHPLEIAKEIQTNLNNLYGLPVSIGIAPTLFLAKMASDMKKPLGITVLRRRDIPKMVFPLPIKELYGVGRKTYPKLIKQGINTIGDFTLDINKQKILTLMTEDNRTSIINSITGNSNDVVDPKKYSIPRSISNETTFNYNIDNLDIILGEMKQLLDVVHKRLISQDLLAKTVFIKIRNSNFDTITRSQTIAYTNDFSIIENIIETLFYDNYHDETLRLVGVGVSSIIERKNYKSDYNLFNYQEKLKTNKK